ncbi:MAG: CHAT domain-containing protein, partial [Microcoleaceae cyanobacterium]
VPTPIPTPSIVPTPIPTPITLPPLVIENQTVLQPNNPINNSNFNQVNSDLSPQSTSILVEDATTRNQIAWNFSQGKIAEAVLSTEGLFSQQFERQLTNSFSNEIQSLNVIQDTLTELAAATGKKPAILYVIGRPEQIDLLLVTPRKDKVFYHTIHTVDRNQVIKAINDLRTEITNPRKRNTQSYLPLAQQLHTWLIQPISDNLQEQEIDTLVFALDSGMRTLPMAALHDGKNFLVEKYSLGLIPSMNLVDTRYESLEGAEVLAMGASKFQELSPLPAVPVELSTIISEWPGVSFLNEKFTLQNLKQQRSKIPYRLIHLATHGEFQPGDISNSFIQLWDDQLHLDDLRQLNWDTPPVELLVLSACRTAIGDEDAELGFAGFAVQAGVKSALASLWYVSDEGTLALMSEFYRNLQVAPIKAEALRQTQIAMLQGKLQITSGTLRAIGQRGEVELPPELGELADKNLSHPYYWSGFTMIGSPW